MLSYQHSYHADNWADSHKHSVLCLLWHGLIQKDKPASYLESHAGRGVYDLASKEAMKTEEAASSLFKDEAFGEETPPLLAPYLQARSAFKPPLFGGSCALINQLKRKQDSIYLCERHPQEFQALKFSWGHDPKKKNIFCHERDGFEGVLALLPQAEPRGLILIDPSYELRSDPQDIVTVVEKIIALRPDYSVMIWYPLLVKKTIPPFWLQLLENFAYQGGKKESVFHHTLKPPKNYQQSHPNGMSMSGVLCLNTPFAVRPQLPQLAQELERRVSL